MDRHLFAGWNIGAVSVKRVELCADDVVRAEVHRHGGDPARVIRALLERDRRVPAGACVTGPQAAAFLPLPYIPESIAIEAALEHLHFGPEMALSLGGESFVVYCLAGGVVRRVLASNRCAAGSGEFLVQQFGRMGLDLAAGLEAARTGRRVALAARCSVHCKSDATHKLNKGECTPADIARSLVAELAAKIAALILSSGWPHLRVLVAGGLAQSSQLMEDLSALLPEARFEAPIQSGYLEALGAAVAARKAGPQPVPDPNSRLQPADAGRFPTRPPLSGFSDRVTRIEDDGVTPPRPGLRAILGVDAGSTTTKAVLVDRDSGRVAASCYLRTHGNPVRAAFECLAELGRQTAGCEPRVVQAAVTGSGRDLVSVYLDGCLVFNEILAHARGARQVAPEVDTLFEIGGQDAKFVALLAGVPVDYSMNDGCSAGTGSFLEEAAASDMQVPIERIGPLALSSAHPVAFGERCAAFINSEVRSALQSGVPRADVLAGLVYAIVENYLSRVVGARHIGRTVLLQGGVALNPALAPAVAALAGTRVTVPPRPELMGCEGAARMAGDLLDTGAAPEWNRELSSFGGVRMERKPAFVCPACENRCEVQRVKLDGRTFPFGGLCSKWEMARRPALRRQGEGRDLVALRQETMFRTFAPPPPERPRGRMGLPLALTTCELYPLYARFLTGLGYEVVLSRAGHGSRRTGAPMCFPAELMHAAVDDLLAQGVDFVFLPYLREFAAPPGHAHGYICPVAQDLPGVIAAFFPDAADRILSPEMGLAPHLATVTEQEVLRLGARLGVGEERAQASWVAARVWQTDFDQAYRTAVEQALIGLDEPAVILTGRPYVAYAPEVNLSVPRKIASRGFTVIPGDALSSTPPANRHNVWHFTHSVLAAAEHARRSPDRYLCDLSCFSCGPDAMMHHRLRRELEGRPFCFLEIDSHTAHAGLETRIGAFLDIIEARRRQAVSLPPAGRRAAPARLEQTNGRISVVTGGGRRLALNAPEVVHVSLSDGPPFLNEMVAAGYAAIGWRTAAVPNTNAEVLQHARRVCSGRECLPFLSMMGKAVMHLGARPPGEVTVFHLLEQEGPCQIGNWHDAAPLLFERLGEENAVVAWPSVRNNYLGQGDRFGAVSAAGHILGDLIAEMRSSLRCLGGEAGLSLLTELEGRLVAASQGGLVALEREWRRGVRRLAQVPLRESVDRTPRVLLFGGINRIFVDGPVRDFFERRGILTKTTEISEFMCFLEFEDILRLGFAYGHTQPAEQSSLPVLLTELLREEDKETALRAARSRLHIGFIEMLDRRWRRIAAASGLLFSPFVSFADITGAGHRWISVNGYTEAPITVGRYASLLASGTFDGYVNIGAFNCAPANTASAVIHSLSLGTDLPYAIIEADGDTLTPCQFGQLETVAAQCRRRRGAA
ncbi:MAG: hypothetical protein HY822_23015 [Acidobacteria bacterium]|nr:hypothetical protein [Acidobacteriota bacterium]